MHSIPGVLRSLTSSQRTRSANVRLATVLTLIAGAVNAGGYLAIQQYTSHMSGIVSAMADHLAQGEFELVVAAASAVAAFIGGAMTCALMVNYGRRTLWQSKFAWPIVLEAFLLACFSVRGHRWQNEQLLSVSITVALLCFMMGLQNAVITKISHAEIRTTHVTGMVTDLGIELGKLIYVNWDRDHGVSHRVVADRGKIRVLMLLVGSFFIGGVGGALGFREIGFAFCWPFAAVLLIVAALPIIDDVRLRLRAD